MAGLAGGALSFSPLALGIDQSSGGPPISETPIAQAVQSVLDNVGGYARPADGLQLSVSMQLPVEKLPKTRFVDSTDGLLVLRQSTALLEGLPLGPSTFDPPLKLSQMMVAQPAGAASPRWMTFTDVPTQLRSSRELSQPMPGAAGVGRQALPFGSVFGAEAEPGMNVQSGPRSLAFTPSSSSPLVTAGSAEKPSAASSSIGALGWEIPPIRWGGSLGYSVQTSSGDSGTSSTSQGIFANMSASSYIYAPWLARVSGRLGITTNNASSNSTVASESSNSSNVLGGGELNMFSSSRYPFRIYFDRTDSRSNGSYTATSYVANRIGLSQNFRAEDSLSGGNIVFDRSSISAADGRKDDVTAMSGGYSLQSGVVQNNLSGRYSLSERTGSSESARLVGLNSSHIANISDTLNLGATANYSDSEIRAAGAGATGATNRGRYLQLYGYGTWLPEFEDIEDLPLTLSGGLRYSGQESEFGGESFKANTLGANLSALYRYSSHLSLSANSAVNKLVQDKGDGLLLTQLGTTINYVGSPLSFGNFSYNWNTGANANWQSAVATTAANTLLNGQISHTLFRSFTLPTGQMLGLNASQSISAINNQQLGISQTVTNAVSANLGLAAGERFTGNLNASVSDVRTTGYLEQEYRILNLGLYGQGQISQVSSANLNLAFSWSDQSYQTVDAVGQSMTQTAQRMYMNGSASYTNGRFAGVRGLRYNLIFAADTRLIDDRLYGNVNGELDRARFSLTNRLDYRIGMLDFRLSLVNNEIGGKKNALLFFQVSRQIGAY